MSRNASRQQVGIDVRACEVCTKEFRPYRAWVVTCSRACRDKRGARNDAPHARSVTYLCTDCGAEVTTVSTTGAGQFKYCPACKLAALDRIKDRKNAARTVVNNPARRAMNMESLLRRRYGMEIAAYRAMLSAQDGRCAICRAEPDPDGIKAASRLHVDHCHDTGAVRALLCLRCNQGLGYFQDNAERMRKAAAYIEMHRSTHEGSS